jgi:hypothetical protein
MLACYTPDIKLTDAMKAPFFYGNGNLRKGLHSLSQRMAKCPHPEKLRFVTESDAQTKADKIGGMEVYECVCGMYHMTTIPTCPICGAYIEENCGCFAELHIGKD